MEAYWRAILCIKTAVFRSPVPAKCENRAQGPAQKSGTKAIATSTARTGSLGPRSPRTPCCVTVTHVFALQKTEKVLKWLLYALSFKPIGKADGKASYRQPAAPRVSSRNPLALVRSNPIQLKGLDP